MSISRVKGELTYGKRTEHQPARLRISFENSRLQCKGYSQYWNDYSARLYPGTDLNLALDLTTDQLLDLQRLITEEIRARIVAEEESG